MGQARLTQRRNSRYDVITVSCDVITRQLASRGRRAAVCSLCDNALELRRSGLRDVRSRVFSSRCEGAAAVEGWPPSVARVTPPGTVVNREWISVEAISSMPL